MRQLARIADTTAALRWIQNGYSAQFAAEDTPRGDRVLGAVLEAHEVARAGEITAISGGRPHYTPPPEQIVWAGQEGPDWMRGGSYMVARRIRVALEHWDRTDLSFQEQVFGRRKGSGAPLTGRTEFDPLDLDAVDHDGNPVIPENAHVRLASAASNNGAQMLRRAYSYNDGLSFVAERWPPWRQGLEYDAGLFFVCYQRDPRQGFIPVFERLSKLDMLNQYATHVGGGLFAIPPGTGGPGGTIGQALFEGVALRTAAAPKPASY